MREHAKKWEETRETRVGSRASSLARVGVCKTGTTLSQKKLCVKAPWAVNFAWLGFRRWVAGVTL